MANIISIGTALPRYCHEQSDILHFMQKAFHLDENDSRKLGFLYRQSDVDKRYSVLEEFSEPEENWSFVQKGEKDKSLNERMQIFDAHAVSLSVNAINHCIKGFIGKDEITHLITVSCTGMSAPGLDLQVAEEMKLRNNIFRTSVNFMGCYAAIHALKIAKMICDSSKNANVVLVCTEICTIHFQKEFTQDNATSSMLFSDGSAAVLVSNKNYNNSLHLDSFHSEVIYKGKNDMSWQLSDHGFIMKLSAYIPDLIQHDIVDFLSRALEETNLTKEDITHWCIHPGGKKIIDVIESKAGLKADDTKYARNILRQYGNMSSPTILFVLKEMMNDLSKSSANVIGLAFGPGLTIESFIATKA